LNKAITGSGGLQALIRMILEQEDAEYKRVTRKPKVEGTLRKLEALDISH
jgi:hypothetical protein